MRSLRATILSDADAGGEYHDGVFMENVVDGGDSMISVGDGAMAMRVYMMQVEGAGH